jgi:hypothetical protein
MSTSRHLALNRPLLTLRILLAAGGSGLFSACSPQAPALSASAPLALVAPLPPDIIKALDGFRAECPPGWAFTQATSGDGKSLVERYDPQEPGRNRWTLLSEKGVAPTAAEQARYRDTRPRMDSTSDLARQLDRTTARLVAEEGELATYEFKLIATAKNDRAAAHMRARFTYHRGAGAFVRVELFNFEPFSPAVGLRIIEARTVLVYVLPTATTPTLPVEVSLGVRGTRFWVNDFETKVVSTFSDLVPVMAERATN